MNRDPLAAVAEYHARAVASGNAWAQRLALKTTFGLAPGEPNRERTESVTETETTTEHLEVWTPSVGAECLYQSWGASAARVSVLELDGRFTKVRDVIDFMGTLTASGEVRWVLTTDLHPLGPRP